MALYDIATGKHVRNFCDKETIHSAAFVENGRRLLTVSDHKKVKLWDVSTGECLREVASPRPISRSDIDVEGKRLLTLCRDRNRRLMLSLLNTETGEYVSKFNDERESRNIHSVCFVDDDRFICGYSDGRVKLWCISTGKCIEHFEKHPSAVFSLVNVGSKKCLSGCVRGIIKLWNVDSGECLRTFKGHEQVRTLAVVDDATFVSGSLDGTIGVYAITRWRLIKPFLLLRKLVILGRAQCSGPTARLSPNELALQTLMCEMGEDVFRYVISYVVD